MEEAEKRQRRDNIVGWMTRRETEKKNRTGQDRTEQFRVGQGRSGG
jgi:hypothetical protein